LGDIVSHAFLVGSAKGNAVYNAWIQEKKNQLEKIDKERDMTVFDKLKDATRNTLFDKFKFKFSSDRERNN